MAEPASLLQRLLKRERILLVLCIAILCGLAWAYLLTGAAMSGSGGMPMDMPMGPMPAKDTAAPLADFALVLAMWWWMMVAMMLPSAVPAILLYERVRRQSRASDPARAPAPAYLFALGYLLCWLGFSLVATLCQHWLTSQGLISPQHLALTNPLTSGAILLAVGLYQLSPLKNQCLAHCRSPASYLTQHWRPGWTGAVLLGVRHGAFCLGCCWALMLLLFVGGVMNILWIVLISLFVFAEKLIPFGPIVGRVAGAVLVVLGFASLLMATSAAAAPAPIQWQLVGKTYNSVMFLDRGSTAGSGVTKLVRVMRVSGQPRSDGWRSVTQQIRVGCADKSFIEQGSTIEKINGPPEKSPPAMKAMTVPARGVYADLFKTVCEGSRNIVVADPIAWTRLNFKPGD